MRTFRSHIFLGLLFGVLCSTLTHANPSNVQNLPLLSPIFSDNMVLQRGRPDTIWGWTTPGSTVWVRVGKSFVRVVAMPDGKWITQIGPFPTGKSFDIVVHCHKAIVTVHNVVSGDVWICAGQSNMESGVSNLTDSATQIKLADYPDIRLMTLAPSDQSDTARVTQAKWDIYTQSSILTQGHWNGFSAIGYLFGKEINQVVHVPIGLIEITAPGAPIDSWISEDYLSVVPEYSKELKFVDNTDLQSSNALPITKSSQTGQFASVMPSSVYNTMIAPIAGFTILGALWYQGEADSGHASLYKRLLPTMIASWRNSWNQDFPFLIVGLSAWEPRILTVKDDSEGWIGIREAQDMVGENYLNCGVVTTYDTGDALNNHPQNKAVIAHRFALLAAHRVYGINVEYSGPLFERLISHSSSRLELQFSHIGEGLTIGIVNSIGHSASTPTDRLLGFKVSGRDNTWYPADAQIVGDEVIVSSAKVSYPTNVRYAWAANPVANLFNKDGLPAVPFSTETPAFPYTSLR